MKNGQSVAKNQYQEKNRYSFTTFYYQLRQLGDCIKFFIFFLYLGVPWAPFWDSMCSWKDVVPILFCFGNASAKQAIKGILHGKSE